MSFFLPMPPYPISVMSIFPVLSGLISNEGQCRRATSAFFLVTLQQERIQGGSALSTFASTCVEIMRADISVVTWFPFDMLSTGEGGLSTELSAPPLLDRHLSNECWLVLQGYGLHFVPRG